MTPVNVIARIRIANDAVLDALADLAACCDEIDAIGGAEALEAYVGANGEALGFSYADFQSFLASAGNCRNVLRNVEATFPVGSRTNLYRLRT